MEQMAAVQARELTERITTEFDISGPGWDGLALSDAARPIEFAAGIYEDGSSSALVGVGG